MPYCPRAAAHTSKDECSNSQLELEDYTHHYAPWANLILGFQRWMQVCSMHHFCVNIFQLIGPTWWCLEAQGHCIGIKTECRQFNSILYAVDGAHRSLREILHNTIASDRTLSEILLHQPIRMRQDVLTQHISIHKPKKWGFNSFVLTCSKIPVGIARVTHALGESCTEVLVNTKQKLGCKFYSPR